MRHRHWRLADVLLCLSSNCNSITTKAPIQDRDGCLAALHASRGVRRGAWLRQGHQQHGKGEEQAARHFRDFSQRRREKYPPLVAGGVDERNNLH
mmetsp:Transcript_30138/g.54796  ORF Transcript_30138/g.54796 Transcript_30138/m.54796 type:complete len:95 (+) Transcript_30138:1226-1510(+)